MLQNRARKKERNRPNMSRSLKKKMTGSSRTSWGCIPQNSSNPEGREDTIYWTAKNGQKRRMRDGARGRKI